MSRSVADRTKSQHFEKKEWMILNHLTSSLEGDLIFKDNIL